MTQTTSNFAEDAIRKAAQAPEFDQPVVLRQSPTLARAVVWAVLGVTIATISWAAIAKIEQVVTATGQLQPEGEVKEIQAPINGVVKEVKVKENQKVHPNDLLLTFDATTAAATKQSLLNIQTSLTQENQLYQAILKNTPDITALQQQIATIKLPPEVTSLALNRLSLVNEIQVLIAQIGTGNSSLNPTQAARVTAARQEAQSRIAAAQLELQQLQQRLAQTKVQLKDAQDQLKIDRQILNEIRNRNQKNQQQANESLRIETEIFNKIKDPEYKDVIAQFQIDRQQQQVLDRKTRLIEQQSTGKIDFEQQQQRVDNRRAEIDQLVKEEARLQLDIRQAREESINAKSTIERTFREQLDNAQQRLAAIDSELNKIIVENTKRLAEINSQLAQADETLTYQELKAPIGGTVFDLKANPGFAPRAGQPEPLLKIVPDDTLIAEVFVTNKDIGPVLTRCLEKDPSNTTNSQPNVPQITSSSKYSECTNFVKAQVRIDSFPFSQYGDIEGQVLSIGSDALPPDQIYPYYRFPVKIKLTEQTLKIERRGKILNELPLQTGMSVNANIIIREKRSVLSLFADFLYEKQQALKES